MYHSWSLIRTKAMLCWMLYKYKEKFHFSEGLHGVSQETADGWRHTYGEDMETIWLY